MREILEAELIAFAKKICDNAASSKNVDELHTEARKLYERITMLKFAERYQEQQSKFIVSQIFKEEDHVLTTASVKTPMEVKEDIIDIPAQTVNYNFQPTHEEIAEKEGSIKNPAMDTIKEIVSEMPEEDESIESSFDLTTSETVEDTVKVAEVKEETLEDFLKDVLPTPTFVKSDATEVTPDVSVKELIEEDTKDEIVVEEESKPISLNDRFKKGLTVGLNDKIAFVNHLFGGNQLDYDRVMSQLTTIENYTIAKNYINRLVKPDYNNWEGKDEYAERFMEIVEQSFA